MNKEKFIKELITKTNYDQDKCIIINNILENHFLIGKNNKEKIILNLSKELPCNKDEAEKIYEIAMKIIVNGLKDKIKHPFRSQN